MASDVSVHNFERDLADLRLLHLADSALPIGGLAHSFGVESLVSRELLGVGGLAEFLRGFLEEAGMVEAVFCREGFLLARPVACAAGEREVATDFCVERW